jgi:ribonuclease D
MLFVLKQAEQQANAELPAQIIRLDEYPGYKQNFKKVKSFIALIGTETELLIENLASKKQINQFLSWYFKLNGAENNVHLVDIMQGWRKPLLGDKLLAFVENDFK